ncbi:MAG: FAD-dependent oxidoreductase [Thermoleophilia bacterium]|nr:FAD-dependent oxidoreductase [Thermoleophilia bacterium]
MSENLLQALQERLLPHLDSGVCPIYVRRMPPCRNACPSSEDIRGHLTRVAQSQLRGRDLEESLDEAWRIIADKNPFPAVIGRICPHPCENACNRRMHDWPLAIHSIERFVGDRGIERGLILHRLAPAGSANRRVAVIGAGPSGFSCAYQLARRGYSVTVFEAADKPGGMLRRAVPAYRLPPEILEAEIGNILRLGVEVRYGMHLGSEITIEQLRSEHDAVYIAIGAHKSIRLEIDGEDLPGVQSALDFLQQVNEGASPDLHGKKVLVTGGGNAAVDAARCARWLGAEVSLSYRRTRFDMPAIPAEITAAEAEGVQIVPQSIPRHINADDIHEGADPNAGASGGISASGDNTNPGNPRLRITMMRTEPGEPDSSGRRRPVPVVGSDEHLSADFVIVAIGQKPDLAANQPFATGSVELPHNPVQALSTPGVFAGGDMLGPDFATTAIGHGRKAAAAIHEFLNGLTYREPHVPRPIDAREMKLDYYLHLKRNDQAELPSEERSGDFREVVLPLTAEQALAESRRCLSCGLCLLCDRCRIYCPREAISKDISRPQGLNMFTDYTRCSGCTICSMTCPCHYIEMGFRS